MRSFGIPRSAVDKRPVKRDEGFRRRTRWAINYVAADQDLTNLQMAIALKMNEGTLSNYRVMKTSPKAKFITGFCELYKFSDGWLLSGQGEPFPGARAKYEDVCGPETPAHYIKEGVAAYAAAGEAQKLNIDEAHGKAYEILHSGTPCALTLLLNIQQISCSLDATKEVKVLRDKIAELQAQVTDLRRQIDGMTAHPASSDQPAASLEKAAM